MSVSTFKLCLRARATVSACPQLGYYNIIAVASHIAYRFVTWALLTSGCSWTERL